MLNRVPVLLAYSSPSKVEFLKIAQCDTDVWSIRMFPASARSPRRLIGCVFYEVEWPISFAGKISGMGDPDVFE